MTNDAPPLDLREWIRHVNKFMERQTRRTASVMEATITGEGIPVRTPVTPPNDTPTGPPLEAPTVQVVGFTDAMTVEVTGHIAPTTVLDYYVNDILVASTTATVLFATKDGNGLPLLPDTDYTWIVVARNDFGVKPSDPVTARLDPGVSSETVLGYVAAGFILSGAIQVGQMTLEAPSETSPGGLRIPLLNGGLIHFPADGSDAVITAVLRARSILVEDYFTLYGDNNKVYGGLTLANGVDAPGAKPRVNWTWVHDDAWVHAPADTSGDLKFVYGVTNGFIDDGTQWLAAQSFFDGYIWGIDKTTGTRVARLTLPDIQPFGGVTKMGSNYYVLAYVNATAKYQIRKYSSTWVLLDTFPWEFADTGGKQPQITNDGTSLLIARMCAPSSTSVNDRLVVRKHHATTGSLQQAWTIALTDNPRDDLRGAWYGTADLSSARLVCATKDRVYSFNLAGAGGAGTRVTGEEFNPANFEECNGLHWTGTQFASLSTKTGRVYTYTGLVTATSRSVKSTKYNTAHGWETPASPVATYTQPARWWLFVEADPPGDAGGTNDPDSVRFYINNHLQTSPPPGDETQVYGAVLNTSSANSPSTNTFPVLLAPGWFASEADDANGPYTRFDGSGAARAAKLIQTGSVTSGTVTNPTITSVAVTFPVPFDVAPRVELTLSSTRPDLWASPSTSGVTTTGFTAYFHRLSGSGSVSAGWVASPAI